MIIAFSIPVFFALIGVELFVARLQGRPDFLRFNDAITALGCGIGNQVVQLFTGVIVLLAYAGLYTLAEPIHALLPWGPYSVVAWVLAAFLFDHQYYWWHRHSHRINFMWAAHVVHHQSQEYNLAVALRQAMFTNLTSMPYYLPLALLGIHPVVFAITAAINTLYQFWIHTRTVGKLGPLEWVLNTPSHHRVHHGINPEYIDRNHAGILIIWDRLYGTFEEERREPVYGTVNVIGSFDPIWANFWYWQQLFQVAWSSPRLTDKLIVWFMPPEWTPHGNKSIPDVDASTFQKWDVPLAPGIVPYVLLHFASWAMVGTVWILLSKDVASLSWLALLGGTILWTTWSFGQLFHRRPIGVVSEILRLTLLPVALGILLWGSPWLWPAVVAAGALSFASIAWVIAARGTWTGSVAAAPATVAAK